MRYLFTICTCLFIIWNMDMKLDLNTARVVTTFWSLVNRTSNKTECWNWIGGNAPNGYGTISSHGFDTTMSAHRFSWITHFGAIPEGLFVLHRCDSPCCVNPKHLFLGTQQDNIRDCRDKGRLKNNLIIYKGEKCSFSKLKEKDILRIREEYNGSWGQLKQLGKRYGVTATSIYNVVHRKCWKHI